MVLGTVKVMLLSATSGPTGVVPRPPRSRRPWTLGENILRTGDIGGVVQQAVLQLIVLGQLLDGQRGDGDGKLVPSLDLAAVLGHGLILGLQFEVGVVLHLQRNICQHAEA